ncbi:MAG: hypothetical protein NTX25_10400, partial [Proteobacteria bacterium]|nr:hypothetical protein [Pseudomonadota bacterium]
MKTFIPVLLALVSVSCRHSSDVSESLSDASTAPAPVEAEGIGDIFRYNFGPRNPGFPKPAVRAAFRRTIGCTRAKFQILDSLDSNLGQGIFARDAGKPTEFDAWVRLSMDRTAPSGTDDFDKSTVAFSLKLLPSSAGGLPPITPVAGEHDIIMQNHHVFFVDTAQEFLTAFFNPRTLSPATLKAVKEKFGPDFSQGLSPEKAQRTDRILAEMNKELGNSLRTTFWSVTPYRYGSSYAKYRVIPVPCNDKRSSKQAITDEPLPQDKGQKNYLRDRFERDLQSASACFDFQIQLHDGKTDQTSATPLDLATVAWDEQQFRPQTVARITLLPLTAVKDALALDLACESMRFSPKHAPAEHAPAGSINEARTFIYDRFSSCRSEQNAGRAGTGDFN